MSWEKSQKRDSTIDKYIEIKEELFQDVAKLEGINKFIDLLKKWVLKDCTIWQDVKMYVGYLRFSFDNNKTQFVLALPFEVSLLLQKYLDPMETEDEKDIQKKI